MSAVLSRIVDADGVEVTLDSEPADIIDWKVQISDDGVTWRDANPADERRARELDALL
jgi:hypothetical protein